WNDYPANLYSDLAKSERNGPFLPAGMDTYIRNSSIVDAWGNALAYNKGTTMPSGVPIIKSYGPDGGSGGNDDITNEAN
ncbi:MAG: type II secretion system protein GspG, partial [Planctomycetia bacterium]|nr:type II secretion system protein GspG [Planctomycetia bacterium]